MGKFSSRPPADVPGGTLTDYPAATDDRSSWPTLVEFLSCERYEDGKVRVPGTVLLFVESGRLKVLFKDKDCKRMSFSTLAGLDGVLEALEGLLAGDELDWRVDRPSTARR